MIEETPSTLFERSAKQTTELRNALLFTLVPRVGICSHATCFSTRAASCVGHFGSAITILDEHVMLWSQNGGRCSACLPPQVVLQQAADGADGMV